MSLTLTSHIDEVWIKKFTNKLFSLQKKYNLFLLGGDIAKSNKINISANFYGYINKKFIIKRNTSKISDSIWVTGNIGQSYIGLLVSQKKILLSKKYRNYFLNKYLFPKPSMFGLEITNLINSCIDISDGFLGDLSKLLNNKKGADLHYSKIPISNIAKKLINKKIVKFNKLLNGGDDYELIFTCPSKNDYKIKKVALKKRVKITKVGRIINNKGLYVEGIKMKIYNNSFQYYF
jgi:thiamine-monophosphate kinase